MHTHSATTANPAQHAARLIGLSDSTAADALAAAAAVTGGATYAAPPFISPSADGGGAASSPAVVDPASTAPASCHAVGDDAVNQPRTCHPEADWQPQQEGCQPWWLGDSDDTREELVLVTQVCGSGSRIFCSTFLIACSAVLFPVCSSLQAVVSHQTCSLPSPEPRSSYVQGSLIHA